MEHFGNEFTTMFYLIDVANSGTSMICVLSEDTKRVCPTGMLGVSGGNGVQCADGAVGYDNAGSALARHACPHQLRHELIFMHQRQDQCVKHLAH